MIPTKQVRLNFKSKDLYKSAWSAIQEVGKILDLDYWRNSGWKPITDFPREDRRRMKDQLIKNPNFENCVVKVRLPGGIRSVTFFRPIITKR